MKCQADNQWRVCVVCMRLCGVGDCDCSPEHAKTDPLLPDHTEEMPAREAPGFIEKLRNFASAAVSHVAAGMPMCDDAEIIRRHDICMTCEHLKDNACQLCGCPVARAAGYVSKLSWADQECPAGKWGKVTPSA
jgi:hypothetical protein